jgi:hypothetical protein
MKVCRVAQEELAAGKIDAGTVGYKMASEMEAEARADEAAHAAMEADGLQ